MTNESQLIWQQPEVITQSQRIINSFYHWFKKDLIDTTGTDLEISERLFKADFFVASHTNQPEPIFNYGNNLALQVWEVNWETLIKLPSRYTAEQIVQEKRDRILQSCKNNGFSTWEGVRISSTGKRYLITNGLLWNLLDENNQFCGQAATFNQWKLLDSVNSNQ